MKRLLLVPLLIVAGAVMAMGCSSGSGPGTLHGGDSSSSSSGSGGGKAVKPVDYARKLCLVYGPVESDLNTLDNLPDTPDAAKRALVDGFTSAQKDTKAAANKLKALGPPDVPDGAAIKSLFLKRVEALADLYGRVATKAKALPSSVGSFGSGVTDLQSYLENQQHAIDKWIPKPTAKYPKGANEVKAAGKSEPACAGSGLFDSGTSSDSSGSSTSSDSGGAFTA
ncbi:MAG: hypothetical protein ABI276_03890 [Acidimicrobiales bacterium]